jgi:hypothetical protein
MKGTAIQPTPGGWLSPNTGATNSSGFTGLPGGLRPSGQGFYDLGGSGTWWSSSDALLGFAWSRVLVNMSTTVDRGRYGVHRVGYSVRCLKNTLPQVNTSSVTNVTPSTALVTGEVITDGGDQNTIRGFCYSTTSNPTVSNDTTMNGTGLGVYSGTLQNLTPLTIFYVRAYATNSLGTSYGNAMSFTTNLTIGTNYDGGIVFYLDTTGQHGLVSAPYDQGTYQWGCHQGAVYGLSFALGSGQTNTNIILGSCPTRPIAASICDTLNLNGYSDWYLPSFSELELMCNNLRRNNLGSFSSGWYWSSSTHWYFFEDAYCRLFSSDCVSDYYEKYLTHSVRAIRSF